MQVPIQLIPLIDASVQAGFPSPAGDHLEGRIDINEHLILHPAATYLVWVSGDSMIGAGIHDGDLMVIDRAIEPAAGHVAVVAIDGQLTLKRIERRGGKLVLAAENPAYPVIEISEESETVIWGVATAAIHFLAAPPPRGKNTLAAE